jgi:hypothetical protein
VDPVPDPLLLKRSGSAADRTRTSGSVGTLTTRPQRRSTVNQNLIHEVIRTRMNSGFACVLKFITFCILVYCLKISELTKVRKVKKPLQHAVEAYRFVRRRGSYTFWTIGPQMAVRSSAFRRPCFTTQEDRSYSFLLVSVNPRTHGAKVNAYNILVWNPEGKIPVGRPRRR